MMNNKKLLFFLRDPSFNKSSHDKHWIIKRSPPISDTKADFIDLLHRRRLLTLLSLDEAIARLYQTVRRLRLLDNTYLFFSSDHGYHLGQFRMVKGKSQPYDTDIRVPLYVFGPGVPVNKTYVFDYACVKLLYVLKVTDHSTLSLSSAAFYC